jgi:hypothetical protein
MCASVYGAFDFDELFVCFSAPPLLPLSYRTTHFRNFHFPKVGDHTHNLIKAPIIALFSSSFHYYANYF